MKIWAPLCFLAVAFAQDDDERKKLTEAEKGPRQCGRIKLADNPGAGGIVIECRSRNGKSKNPNRTKRCKTRCVDTKRNNDTPKKFYCMDNQWKNKQGTKVLNTKNLGCK